MFQTVESGRLTIDYRAQSTRLQRRSMFVSPAPLPTPGDELPAVVALVLLVQLGRATLYGRAPASAFKAVVPRESSR